MSAPAPITAIVYGDGDKVDRVIHRLVAELTSRGLSIAGFVQIDRPRKGRSRCDMVLHEMASGAHVNISQDRGALARGCMLDGQELARAEVLALAALRQQPDLFVINKFGKTEAEGGGFRSVISAAIENAVPVLIAVPCRNLDPWHNFTGGLSRDVTLQDLSADAGIACDQLGFPALKSRRPASGPGTTAACRK